MPWAAAVLAIAAAVIDAWSAAHHGPDFRDFLSGGARLIAGTNLYEGSGAYNGFIGPPFQAMLHAPFAAIAIASPSAALWAWVALSFAALVAGISLWAGALRVPATSPAVLAAAVTLWFPFYRESQAQNMTALLLFLAALAARALSRARDGEAGMWMGLAAALKLFPGLALVYFAARGRWRAVIAGAVAGAAFTLVPMFRYGIGGFVALWKEWLRTRQVSVWPSNFQSQSLPHAVRLLWPGDARAGAATVAFLALVAVTVLIAWSRRRMPMAAGGEMAFVTLAAFLASPIGWIQYWILALPALIAVTKDADRRASQRTMLTVCGVVGAVIGPLIRDHPRGEYLVIGLLLFGALAYRLRPGAASSVAS